MATLRKIQRETHHYYTSENRSALGGKDHVMKSQISLCHEMKSG